MTRPRISCPKCGAHVVPGTIYCWRCPIETRVGELYAEAGQLYWKGTGRSRPSASWTVLHQSVPVELASATVAGQRPVELVLRMVQGNRELSVQVAELLRALAEEDELVHAAEQR